MSPVHLNVSEAKQVQQPKPNKDTIPTRYKAFVHKDNDDVTKLVVIVITTDIISKAC